MRGKITLAAALALVVLAVSAPAKADHDEWFNKYDRDHDGRWTYKEFRSAHYKWLKEHPGERHCSEHDLHGYFNKYDRDHDGYVHCDEVRDFHHW
jgi:Ca2+-binding EF-hand superfamily protein